MSTVPPKKTNSLRIWMMRLLGGGNLLFAGLGVVYSVGLMTMSWQKRLAQFSEMTALDWAIRIASYAVSFAFLVFLSYAGVALLRGRARLLRALTWAFLGEAAFFAVTTWVDWLLLPPQWSMRAISYWENGLDPLTPQLLAGYPLAGAITALLLILTARGKSASA
jgi:hypothetical protein